jgi:HAD superfamily hydrolase (TIGR01450 family)
MTPFELVPGITPPKRVIIDALVCDLDGVVYRGDRPVEGAAEAVERLRAADVRLLFCTNNSRSTVDQYVKKLTDIGIPVEPEDILTSAVVTAEELQRRGHAGRTAIVVGGDGIRDALSSVCISVKDDPHVTVADLVVVGWTPDFGYDEMRRATKAVLEGGRFFATNDDAAFPAAGGELWPGAGAILASIERATGARAEVMGKPNPPMMDAAARRLDGAERIAVLGDRPETDLAGGTARGWTTILALSGVTDAAQAARLEPQPDVIVETMADL